MKRILYVVNHAGFFVSHRLRVALAAKAAGYDVHVAAGADGKEAEIVAAGLQFHPWHVKRASEAPLDEARALASLDAVVRALRPDLMHLVTMKGMLYGGAVARARRVPATLFAISGLGYVFLREGPRAALFRRALLLSFRMVMRRRAAHSIFQNHDDRGVFDAAGCIYDANAYTMIRGSGVDTDQFYETPLPEDVPMVVLPARMLRDKGVVEFVAAARLLKARGLKARFVLAGGTDVNPASIPAETLRQWQEEGVVEWWGHQSDMAAVLRSAYLVCLPSYREGLPKALLEAAASGRPMVSTDVPGCREVVQHGKTGFLVPLKSTDELADAMQTLIADRELAAQMGMEARASAVRDFALPAVIDKHLDVYQRLVSAKP